MKENKEQIKKYYEVYPEYCCLDLVRAVQSGFIDEVVSGLFFPNQDDSSCKEEVMRLKYCPFCRAKIITIKTETGWDWKTESDSL
jgi:hypothetical protein